MTDQELIGYLDRRFGEILQKVDEKVDGLREEIRQTRAVVEGIPSEVRLVAEGVMGVREQRSESRQLEILLKLDEVKASIDPLYKDLRRRVKDLEERAEGQARRVMELIRERFGKH